MRQWACRVDGIELLRDMADPMREKPGDATEMTTGNICRVTTGRTTGWSTLAYNRIGNLLTQDDDVACFQNAARHLNTMGISGFGSGGLVTWHFALAWR